MITVSLLTVFSRDRSKSPRRSTHGLMDPTGRPVASVDELSLVGHSEDADLYTVFEKSGMATQ